MSDSRLGFDLVSHVGIFLQDTVSESELSAAPTDVYLSPHLTPRRRSLVDLTLQSEATHYDLKDQLEKQLDGERLYNRISKIRYRYCQTHFFILNPHLCLDSGCL